MNGIGSSPPSPFGRKDADDSKDQIQETVIAADVQRESLTRTATPSPTEMPSSPSAAGAEAEVGPANRPATVTEPAVECEDEMEVDPRDEIQEFDWGGLQQRYHNMIKERGHIEDQLWEEFSELLQYFTIWSETNQTHEVDRSFKRLKTRIHHVQSSEDQFEAKRKHYISVVNAFQSALALLNQSKA